jgi:solute carrier family 13 (sodium-dependent dicarboxylate transporter), member 2/3/5
MSDEDSPDQSPRGWAERIGFVLGPALFALTFVLPPPPGMSPEAWRVAGLGLWMAVWWATEAAPMAATALLPLVLIPVVGAGNERQAAAPYANPIVLLLLGGSILAVAIERWGLHKRLALFFLSRTGLNLPLLVLAFMAVTAFISMWVSNTATSLMMMPIALSVAAAAGAGDKFTKAMVLGVAYAATIGGVATPIGTPTNLIAMGWLNEEAGVRVAFLDWMAIGVPALLILLPAAWFVVTFGMGKAPDGAAQAQTMLRSEYQGLGRLRATEARVLGLFVLVIGLWASAEWMRSSLGLKWVTDLAIVMAGAILMMVIPAGREGPGRALLTWQEATKIPWGVILLFGGGISMAEAMERTGLAGWLGEHLQALTGLHPIVLIFAIALLVIVLTEFMSNVATITMMLPILAALAAATGVAPVSMVVPAAIAASCGFMMPAGTGPNAVAMSTGKLKVANMMARGFVLNLIALAVMTGLGFWLAPLILG